jgi:hypothetical protein
MHYSHSLQKQVAPQRAIAHIREFFVSELEWFIVSLYQLALPCARRPRNSQSEVCEFKGYFYLLPLTDPHTFLLRHITPPIPTLLTYGAIVLCGQEPAIHFALRFSMVPFGLNTEKLELAHLSN